MKDLGLNKENEKEKNQLHALLSMPLNTYRTQLLDRRTSPRSRVLFFSNSN